MSILNHKKYIVESLKDELQNYNMSFLALLIWGPTPAVSDVDGYI